MLHSIDGHCCFSPKMTIFQRRCRIFAGICLFLTAHCLFAVTITTTHAYTPNDSQPSPSSHRGRNTPFIRKQDMIGIWRLTHPKLSLPRNVKDVTTSSQSENDQMPTPVVDEDDTLAKIDEDIVLRLNDDGSFDPYTAEGDRIEAETSDTDKESQFDVYSLEGVLSRGGSWTFRDGNLILAPDRPEGNTGLGTKVHDTLLAGQLNVQVSECLSTDDTSPIAEVDRVQDTDKNSASSSTSSADIQQHDQQQQQPEIDVHLSIPSGNVKMGKFMYPRRHKAFFDEPMLFPESYIGTFAMQQLLGNLNTRLKQEQEGKSNQIPPKFDRKNFYDRRFYLTATPHAVNPSLAAQDKHYDADNVKYDVRVIPITFHSNNTFTAIGTEKVLRGRFGITGDEGHKLWFQVNLFGFGRSAPGSVYSEGRLLSHDDKRGYLGDIQEYQGGEIHNKTMYFVDGEFYYGTDLKRTNKAHSWGAFSLQEVDPSMEELVEDDEEEEDEDARLESLFQASDSDISESPLNDDGEDAFQ